MSTPYWITFYGTNMPPVIGYTQCPHCNYTAPVYANNYTVQHFPAPPDPGNTLNSSGQTNSY